MKGEESPSFRAGENVNFLSYSVGGTGITFQLLIPSR